MYTILMILALFMSFLLIIVVLLQASKGDGLSGTFGGASGSLTSAFGSRKTADLLSKTTWWLGGGLLFIALLVNLFFLPGQTTDAQRKSIVQQAAANEVPSAPALPQNIAPNVPTTQQKAPAQQPKTEQKKK